MFKRVSGVIYDGGDLMNLVENIETDRCILQLLCLNDIEEAVELFTNSDARKYLGGAIPKEEAIKKLNRCVGAKKKIYLWSIYYCVRLKDTGKFIGIVSITPHHNLLYKELSYQFLPSIWGNGYAYETIKSLIQYCTYNYKLHRLVSETQVANVKSCKLLEKLGYKLHKKLERFNCEQSLYVLNLRNFTN